MLKVHKEGSECEHCLAMLNYENHYYMSLRNAPYFVCNVRFIMYPNRVIRCEAIECLEGETIPS